MGLIQAAWMGVGFRIAIAAREPTSHLPIPNSRKSAGGAFVGVGVVVITVVGGGGRFFTKNSRG